MIWVTGPVDACPVTAEVCTGLVCTTDITLPRLEIWEGGGGESQGVSDPPPSTQRGALGGSVTPQEPHVPQIGGIQE